MKPGKELQDPARFFQDRHWSGTVMADGMGTGSPAMDATGSSICRRIPDCIRISCMFEQDQYVEGKKVITWKAH
jgi:hypothetical protein